jgi:hypothetical protein
MYRNIPSIFTPTDRHSFIRLLYRGRIFERPQPKACPECDIPLVARPLALRRTRKDGTNQTESATGGYLIPHHPWPPQHKCKCIDWQNVFVVISPRDTVSYLSVYWRNQRTPFHTRENEHQKNSLIETLLLPTSLLGGDIPLLCPPARVRQCKGIPVRSPTIRAGRPTCSGGTGPWHH